MLGLFFSQRRSKLRFDDEYLKVVDEVLFWVYVHDGVGVIYRAVFD